MMHPKPCDLGTETEDSGVRSLGNGRLEATGPKPPRRPKQEPRWVLSASICIPFSTKKLETKVLLPYSSGGA